MSVSGALIGRGDPTKGTPPVYAPFSLAGELRMDVWKRNEAEQGH